MKPVAKRLISASSGLGLVQLLRGILNVATTDDSQSPHRPSLGTTSFLSLAVVNATLSAPCLVLSIFLRNAMDVEVDVSGEYGV